MPSSYYTYRYTDAYQYASAYDPAFYNIMVSGDQVWVEPKYITSMFGTWGASVVVPTYSWYYGWTRPSYSWWYGYPRYSWYDWGYSSIYDPYWGWSWGFGWGGIHTTQDLSHRTITTTTIRLTMAVAAISVLLWHTVQIALRLAVDLRTLTEQLVPQLLSRV